MELLCSGLYPRVHEVRLILPLVHSLVTHTKKEERPDGDSIRETVLVLHNVKQSLSKGLPDTPRKTRIF